MPPSRQELVFAVRLRMILRYFIQFRLTIAIINPAALPDSLLNSERTIAAGMHDGATFLAHGEHFANLIKRFSPET